MQRPSRFLRTPLTCALVAAVALLASGCSGFRMPGIYRIDIQQGNVITQEQLAALERGMEKRKVRFILGTPLVEDAFNQDRWDYYYSFDRRGEDRVQRVISVYFQDERLVRVAGDVRAATGPIVVDTRKDELVSVPDGYRDEGLLAALTPDFLSGKPKRQPKPAAAQTPEAAPAPGQPAAGTPAAASGEAIRITEEDERFLRDLLEGFGREDATASAAATSAPAVSAGQGSGQATEEEGVLSRWARRLGLTGEGGDTPASPPPAGTRARE